MRQTWPCSAGTSPRRGGCLNTPSPWVPTRVTSIGRDGRRPAWGSACGGRGSRPAAQPRWPAAAQSLLDERIAIRSKEDEEGLNAWGPAYELAAIHAVLGRRPEALTWLRRAVERGWREAHLAEIDVMLQTLSGDPEYERILRDVRRQVAQMKVRAGRIGLPQ